MKKQKIVIVGGGTAGWITAAIFAKGLPQTRFDITLVESPNVPTIGVGEATIPPIVLLLDYLEIDRKAFLKSVNGTYKYGIHFENWSQIGDQYMHAFGEVGTPYNGKSFTDMWLKCRSNLNLAPLNQYSPTAIAAYQNKFHPVVTPPEGANPNHFYPLSGLFYAFQFDAGLLIKELQQYATTKGIKHQLATIEGIKTGKYDYISQLQLDSGELLEGDFFVDCSGIRGILNKQHYKNEFIDWTNYLPCNSAIAMQTKLQGEPSPYTKSIAMSSGWRWQIPLRTRTGNGYVYSDRFISDDQAMHEFKSSLSDQEALTEARVLKFTTGCLKTPWYKNSIAIGLSSGFFEPLESTSIHLIHKFAIHLKNALLHGTNVDQEAELFNHSFKQVAESIRDFLVAHYAVTKRQDTPFWSHCHSMTLPDNVNNYLAEFRQTGFITLPKDNLFSYESWLQLLVGQGYLDNYEHLADSDLNNSQVAQFFTNVNHAINAEVDKIRSHQEYLSL